MGLFGKNTRHLNPDEWILIDETLWLVDVISNAESALKGDYLGSLAKYLPSIKQLGRMIVGDLVINAYQRTGKIYKKEDFPTNTNVAITLESIRLAIEAYEDYPQRLEHAFLLNDPKSEETAEILRDRGILLRSYLKMIESGLVLEASGFNIGVDEVKEETHDGRYL